MKTVTLENESLRLVVLPECGGKIANLVDLRNGRDWLWQNPVISQRVPEFGESYVEELDTGGWDEVLPSVNPCTLPDGTIIPDHGDLVSLPWQVLENGDGFLVMEGTLRSLPLVLTRTLRLGRADAPHAPELTTDYRLRNTSEQGVPFIYAAHPLFPLEPGMTIGFREAGDFLVTGVEGDAPAAPGEVIRWPDRFTVSDETPAHAIKLFSAAGRIDQVELTSRCGDRLRMSWDAGLLPHLGIWLNNGGWSGRGGTPYHNVGLEPTTTAGDQLDTAMKSGTHRVLAPGATAGWRIRMQFG